MKVTVIMAVFNAETYLAQAIESVLNQTYKNFEFIIINDGSTDNSLQVIKKYSATDSRIILDDHVNMGKGESFNRVVDMFANGEYLFHMDADDIMLPNRIERQLNFLASQDIEAISCLAYYISGENVRIGKVYNDIKTIEVFNDYIQNNEPIGLLNPGFVIRKDIFNQVGGYRGRFWPADDIDLYNRVTEIGAKILVQQEILMQYRIHGGSVITSKFINGRMKFEWVRESMWKRRKGETEPTWEEYLAKLNSQSFAQKLNWKRKTYAKHYYRSAGFDFAKKNYSSFIFHLVSAFILQPIHIINKISKQWTN